METEPEALAEICLLRDALVSPRDNFPISANASRLANLKAAVFQSHFWPKAIFIVARGIAPG